ncbi:MAG TPA: hypothetical protein VFJ77_07410 [Gaiellaceae bacterium]|nr:hypothetical protein [Gaiellaceae bacterium]
MSKIFKSLVASKMALAAVSAVTVFGGVYGFAASLGTTTSGLGADSKVVAACGSGIAAAYTTAYSASLPGYTVNAVNLSSIPASCLSKGYKIQLTGASGTAVGGELTGTLPASGDTASISTSGAVDASQVQGISVVIS